jgi:uncharacterized protein
MGYKNKRVQIMDKDNALKLSIQYLKCLKENNIKFIDAWLFGSYATGSQRSDSDIDIAIIFEDDKSKTFENEVKLMIIRNGEETLIEPHAFTKDEFKTGSPLINEIINYGEKLII